MVYHDPMTKNMGPSLLLLLFFFASSVEAQNLAPRRTLTVIRTEKFDIIFPEESRRSAETLALMADSAYQRISGLLDIQVKSRIPVLISPDIDEFNGYLNPMPYPHIVIYDAPVDPEWTTFSDDLYGVFFHELTHAVSLSSRNPAASFLSSIFGSWVIPAYLDAPPYMVEGVTVSFESLDGYGRANDPLVVQRLRQARFEGRFLSPFQVAGAWDNPSYWRSKYEYGGLFSAYVQKRWGMETYAELWQRMGGLPPLSFSYYGSGFSEIFRRVTGVTLKSAWSDFEASFSIAGVEPPGKRFIPDDTPERNDARRESPGEESPHQEGGPSASVTPTGGTKLIGAMDSDGGLLVWYDELEHTICAADAESGAVRPLLRGQSAVTSLDLSKDGSRLLVGSFSYRAGRAVATAVEYDLTVDTATASGRRWTGLFTPHYFRDGLVALEAEGRKQSLVIIDAKGARKVIAEGSDQISFAEPVSVDEVRVAYLAAVEGVRRLRLYDAATGVTSEVMPKDAADDTWRYARTLEAVNGVLYFTYSTAGSNYRLGTIRGDEVSLAGLDLSGGVSSALPLADRIVYRAEFATRDSLRIYPSDREDPGARRETLTLEPVDTLPAAQTPSLGGTGFEERPYSPFRYLNPALFWLPYPLIRSDSSAFRLDGLGAVSYLSDPTDMNTFFLTAGWDYRYGAVTADLLWSGYPFGFPASVELSDAVAISGSLASGTPYRALRALGTLTWSMPLRFQGRQSFALGGGATRVSLSPGIGAAAFASGYGDSAYDWTFSDPIAYGWLSGNLSNRTLQSWELFGRGGSLSATGYWIPSSGDLRGDLVGVVTSEGARSRLVAYGALDGQGMTPSGYSTSFGTSSWVDSAEPFADQGQEIPWVAGVEGEFKLFSLEIQGNVSHLYFNRLFGTLSYRGVCFDDGDLGWTDSITARVGSVITLAPVAASPLSLAPHLWAALSLPALWEGHRELLVGLSLSMSR